MVRILIAGVIVVFGFLLLRLSKTCACKYRVILIVITVCYVCGVLFFTLLSRSPSSGNEVNVMPFYTLVRSVRHPFHLKTFLKSIVRLRFDDVLVTTIPLETAVLNILLFIPMGYLLPEWLKGTQKYSVSRVLKICLMVSISIEMVQLVTQLGWFDIDDLICNVLGGLLGLFIYHIGDRMVKCDEKNQCH